MKSAKLQRVTTEARVSVSTDMKDDTNTNTTVAVDVKVDTNDPKSNKKKKKDKKKGDKEEEDVPDLGGLKRLKKEFGQGYSLYLIVGGFCAFCQGGMMPLFAVIFAEILDILADSVDENGNSHFARDSLIALLYFVGMGLGCLVFNIGQFVLFGIYGASCTLYFLFCILYFVLGICVFAQKKTKNKKKTRML